MAIDDLPIVADARDAPTRPSSMDGQDLYSVGISLFTMMSCSAILFFHSRQEMLRGHDATAWSLFAAVQVSNAVIGYCGLLTKDELQRRRNAGSTRDAQLSYTPAPDKRA